MYASTEIDIHHLDFNSAASLNGAPGKMTGLTKTKPDITYDEGDDENIKGLRAKRREDVV